MPDYTLDWDGSGTLIDGDNDFTGAAEGDVTVTVSTPDNAGGESFFVQNNAGGGVGNVLGAYYPDRPTDGDTEVTMGFSAPVENVTFSLYDVDTGTGSGSSEWHDVVTIIATLSNGTPVTITFDSAGNQIVNGNVISGNGSNTPRGDEVEVTIDGPIDDIQIIYNDGTSGNHVGYMGIGDVSFDVWEAPCFAHGTMITTDRGDVAVQDLVNGDMVKTADSGFQPIRWIGSATVSGTGSMAPICITTGTIGNTSDLLLSPAHRVLLKGWQAELLFGETELLASAKSMVNDKTVFAQPQKTVEYFHILFDKHEIIFSNGAETESFHPGDAGISSVSQDARKEILALFPQLASRENSYGPAARQSVLPHEVALMRA